MDYLSAMNDFRNSQLSNDYFTQQARGVLQSSLSDESMARFDTYSNALSGINETLGDALAGADMTALGKQIKAEDMKTALEIRHRQRRLEYR